MAGTGPQLRDIHLPPEPSWWPPAPGWWLLALLLVGAMMWLGFKLRRRLRRRRRDRSILAELARYRSEWTNHRNDATALAELSAFLRRLSRAVNPASAVLANPAWIEFLDRHGDGFAGKPAEGLLESAFQKNPNVDIDRLLTIVQRHTRRVLATELANV
ncbi:MAG: DUF4381 domain-containing protein [Tahibacter sp.]